MAATPVVRHLKVIDYVDCIHKYQPDRIYVRLKNDKSLLHDIRLSRKRQEKRGEQPIFNPVSGALHEGFDAESFKTREEDLTGNLRLSFSSVRKTNVDVDVDADIDIFSDVLFHTFGEVFWNHLTGLTTSPFRVYKILVDDGIQPEYTLGK